MKSVAGSEIDNYIVYTNENSIKSLKNTPTLNFLKEDSVK